MRFPPSIFRAYDIRGTTEQLSPELAFAVGAATVRRMKAHTVVVGRDMRESGSALSQAVMEGIRSEGARAVDIGECTTSLFNFAVTSIPTHDAGVMVTASHNPSQYNGFKVYEGNGLPVSGEEMGRLIEEGGARGAGGPRGAGGEAVTEMGASALLSSYIDRLFSLVPAPALEGKTIVIDAGNGMGRVTFDPLLERLDANIIRLYFDPDGRFPNHEANPVKFETLKDLQAKMKEVGADLGVALDGDADRILFLDENGEPIHGDVLLAFLATERLAVHPGDAVVWSPNASWAVRDAIKAAGGRSILEKVGRANLARRVQKEKAAIGGEVSGHYFYPEFQGLESVDFTFLLVLSAYAREGKSMSQLIAPHRTYVNSGERNFEVEDKDGAIARFKKRYMGEATAVSELDGVRLEFSDWWFNVRKSNTEPLVRLTLEAKTKGLMEEKVGEVEGVINA
ncbi:phosphomannomutase/phosphoglucomutase [Candidatus Uhrbacteria bacterium]|nr:phosphomannomutase/phosphoglucomutase [Candidatus Uhrbacteria bacterium]